MANGTASPRARAEPLARAGYRVRFVDPVADHVAEAATHPGVSAVVGDARALPAADDSVDAVLLFGPLYHLLERADRITAWREAGRVTRPGGLVVAATISRFASLFDGFLKDHYSDPRFRPMVERTLTDGSHRPDPGLAAGTGRTWFTTAYFHHPDELAGEVAEAGLVLRRRVAVEGPVWMAQPRLTEVLASPHTTNLLLDMLRTVEDEPGLLGSSSHLLTIATAP